MPGRGCRGYRAAAVTVLAASLAYAAAVLLGPEELARTLVRVLAAAVALAVGWVAARILWLQCPSAGGGEALRRVAELPPG